MENPIKGYRELSPAEIDIVNVIKSEGVILQELISAVREHLRVQMIEAGVIDPSLSEGANGAAISSKISRINDAEPMRWAALARTHFQEGLMALTRAVAQPTTF